MAYYMDNGTNFCGVTLKPQDLQLNRGIADDSASELIPNIDNSDPILERRVSSTETWSCTLS